MLKFLMSIDKKAAMAQLRRNLKLVGWAASVILACKTVVHIGDIFTLHRSEKYELQCKTKEKEGISYYFHLL